MEPSEEALFAAAHLHDGSRCSICAFHFEPGEALAETVANVRFNIHEIEKEFLRVKWHPECKLEEYLH